MVNNSLDVATCIREIELIALQPVKLQLYLVRKFHYFKPVSHYLTVAYEDMIYWGEAINFARGPFGRAA